ncbi:hypothetical protein JXA02_04960 [candidate division KSB1 bacterium]|nr:hypothetical protein [candidate division KSB1 bacterium]RQW08447.1 MAG: hypothetical protein EH222_05650 [candidate division KSB1 bacterium]
MFLAKYLHSFASIFIVSAIYSFVNGDVAAEYQNYHDLTVSLQAAARQHPSLLKIESLGKTAENRDLWLLTMGKAPADEKPAIAILGGVDAYDVAASELCRRFIDSALRAYGVVDSVTSILDRLTFYILPRVNPDASEQQFAAIKYDRVRNSRPVDSDFDGAIDEDDHDDLNGDGYITLMRIADPAGEWMVDPLDPRLMRRAAPHLDERGAYQLLTEGIDNDKDGAWDEDPAGGVNFNRNFSFNYRPTEGAGPHPVSEMESRAVADFLFSHPNVALVFCFSQQENLLHPWDVAGDADVQPGKPITRVLPKDGKFYKFIADQFKRSTGFDPPPPERGYGAFPEWAYYHYGRWSFAAPSWCPPAMTAGDTTDVKVKDDPLARERQLLAWTMKNAPNRFVEWSAFDHPDFPTQKVEIGGFVAGSLNPPSLTKEFTAFFYQLAAYLPKLDVQVKVEATDQFYRITATIINSGYLPTCSELGAKSKWLRKVKAELILSDAHKLISGNRFYLIDAIATVAEKQWSIIGKSGSTVKVIVASPSVGYVEKEIRLD